MGGKEGHEFCECVNDAKNVLKYGRKVEGQVDLSLRVGQSIHTCVKQKEMVVCEKHLKHKRGMDQSQREGALRQGSSKSGQA